MSLILEALRKSEAERRRGQAPGLFTPDAAVLMPGHARGSRWLLVSAVVLALLALAAAGWWWQAGGQTKATAPAMTTTSPDTGSPKPAATAPATPVASTPPPEPAMPAASAQAQVPTAATPPATAMPASPGARPALPERPLPAPALDPVPAPATGSATASSPTPVSPSASSSDEPPAVTLAALSSARRSQLPPLKLSMHVYNDEATRRFAIVDGQRITEGSQLGAATVSAIRRDGVLIELDGERYLLPRP
jgi:general secretion pathway protein B